MAKTRNEERMTDEQAPVTAEVVLPGVPLDESIAFFTERLGFRLQSISPADDPAVAVIAGHGLRIRLDRALSGSAGILRLPRSCLDNRTSPAGRNLTAPNGTRIELVAAEAAVSAPPLEPSLVVSRSQDGPVWTAGRAGMRYRDLLPGRQGGRFGAAHIQTTAGGPVADYVHFHRVHFQVIACVRGWVRVVYEDQGPPFVLEPGDCVVQPPRIRHRVLESSRDLEVVEVSCPAAHETCVDHELELPSQGLHPDRDFAGQRFVRHVAANGRWEPWRFQTFEARDTGIGAATAGVVGVRFARPVENAVPVFVVHDGDLVFTFVASGAATLHCHGRGPEPLERGDAFAVPAGMPHALRDASRDLMLLEVAAPATCEVNQLE